VKTRGPHLLSYLAAFVIGVILFAMIWHWLFGSASGSVVIAGIAGVLIAVFIYLVRSKNDPPGGT
jgi:hypothetical protein